MEFVCIKKCFWLSLIEENQVITVDKEEEIPPSVRPYFESKEKVEAEKIEAEEGKVDEVETLMTELEELGVSYDRRWSKTTLEGKLQLARRDKK